MGEPPVVALIGMRGAGKTTLGRGVAQLLGFDFEDLDEAMAAASGGKLPPQIVAESGWEAFRTLEGDTFAAAARAQGVAKVIATGGGIIETERGLGLLRSHRPVIFIDRHIDDVMATLEGNEASQAHRVSLGEPPRDTYRRRLPKYVEAADFRFPIAQGEKDLPSLITALARFVTVALGLALPCTVSDSFFISLTAEDYAPLVDQKVLQLAALDSDVLEFRVDLLKSWEPANVLHQAALIRSGAPGTPMLFTVRSVEHGGKFNGTEDEYFQLNELGLQLCAEFLDVECTWSSQRIAALVARKNHSQLVGSYHNFDRMLDRNELKDVFQQCLLGGAVAIAKVVVKAERREDNWTVQEVGQAVTSTASSKAAFIGLCLGEAGKLSRVLNQVMCPSMHPSLAPGAPGQMSVSELLSTRRSLGLLGSTRQFVVLSPYPGTDAPAARAGAWTARALRSAFQQLKVAHAVVQAPADEVQRVLALASTGGAVVLGAHPSLQLATADWADVSYVDCVAQVRGGVITGHCCKSEPLKERLKTLASKRTALVLGDPAAAAAGLKAAGFQRVAAVAGAPASTAAVEGVEMVEDLVQVKDIDAVVYVGSHTLKSEVTNCLRDRLQSTKPMVVDMSLPMEAPQAADWLVELAEQCGCKVWPADAFFLQEVLAWLRAWHIEAKPELVAQALLGELGRDASTAAIEALAGREAWA